MSGKPTLSFASLYTSELLVLAARRRLSGKLSLVQANSSSTCLLITLQRSRRLSKLVRTTTYLVTYLLLRSLHGKKRCFDFHNF
jgi:hypothetical protein